MIRNGVHRIALTVLLGAALGTALQARQGDPADLRQRLMMRYDVLALQDGIGLVPRDRTANIRLIQIRDGVVTIDDTSVTGSELRNRLGADADLILRVTYLDAAAQRRLAQGSAQANTTTSPAPPSPAPPSPAPPSSPPPLSPTPAPAPEIARTVRRSDDVVRIMGGVTVERDERVEGDVVVVMGSGTINGAVDGDVVIVMGNGSLGPDSIVDGDVTIVGGTLTRASGARVTGKVQNVGIGGESSSRQRRFFPFGGRTALARVGSFAGTVVRICLMGLLALVVVAFGREHVTRIADRTAADPLRAGFVGFLAEVLFLPVLVITAVALAVSIVGIPLLLLLPFVLVLALVVMLVGFAGAAYQTGRLAIARFGWTDRGPYATVLMGVAIIAAVTLIARAIALVAGGFAFPLAAVGFLVEYAAWTLGLGAIILAWMHRRETPPPITAP